MYKKKINLIVSGSDDTCLCLWEMYNNKENHSRFETKHKHNIFHALFVPETNDFCIVPCALDDDIRYNDLEKKISKRIGK